MMTRLATLEVNVRYKEGGMRPWLDTQFKTQVRRVQRRLDAFELSISQQLSGGHMLDIIGIKSEGIEIKRMVHELHDRPVIPEPMSETIVPTIHVLKF